ncbi:MAG: sigma-70 family RNA polymerase sigma factor [Ruthenibacterium sp.]
MPAKEVNTTITMTSQQFNALVQQYEKLVYTICYQFVHDAQLAEDLAQETFLSAYMHSADCAEGQYKPWLARIATNKAKDYLKSAYHRRVNAPGDEAMEVLPVSEALHSVQPEDITVTKDEVSAIHAEILALKEPYHEVAVRYFMREQSVDEIARALTRPPKTVHTQIYRAKQMLRDTLQNRRASQ